VRINKTKKDYFGIAGTRERDYEMLVEGFTTFPPLDLAMFSSCSVSARAVYICIDLSNAPAFYCMYCIVLYCIVLYCIVLYCIVLYCIYILCMPAKILWEIRVCCLYQSAKFVIVYRLKS
jgi:hypothetical protein